MEQPKSLNKIIEASIKKNWDCPALSDYNGVTLYYRDVSCSRCADCSAATR